MQVDMGDVSYFIHEIRIIYKDGEEHDGLTLDRTDYECYDQRVNGAHEEGVYTVIRRQL